MRFTVAFLLAAVASVAFLLVGTVDQSVLISYLLGEQEENDEATDSFSPVAGQPLALKVREARRGVFAARRMGSRGFGSREGEAATLIDYGGILDRFESVEARVAKLETYKTAPMAALVGVEAARKTAQTPPVGDANPLASNDDNDALDAMLRGVNILELHELPNFLDGCAHVYLDVRAALRSTRMFALRLTPLLPPPVTHICCSTSCACSLAPILACKYGSYTRALRSTRVRLCTRSSTGILARIAQRFALSGLSPTRAIPSD